MSRFVAKFRLALLMPLLAGISCAQPEYSSWEEALAEGGLVSAEEQLVDQSRSAETAFLLGSVQILRAFESVLQIRYANFSGELPLVPGMQTRLPQNPDANFDPAFFETAMTGALSHLAMAERSLERATAGEFEVDVQILEFWFDIDADGERADWEGLIDLMTLMEPGQSEIGFDGIVRFDTADAEWLAAYVHAVAGMAEFALSLDPTPAIRTISEGRDMLTNIGAIMPTPLLGDDAIVDTIAAVLLTLQGVPDRTRTRAAHAHFKAMIAHNQSFWDEVEQETDNNREWLPNAEQTTAFGVGNLDRAALAWRDVLAEIDAILDGDVLIPYWRVSPERVAGAPVGLNLRRLFEEPGDMDIVLWIQGAAAAPYLEQGPLADMSAWGQFLQMTPGNSLLYAIWFN